MSRTNIQNILCTSLLIAASLFAGPTLAKSPVYTGYFSNLAVSGYDAVSYFTMDKPVKGSSKYSTEHMGASWQFSSQENLDAFTVNPEKYAPQYGGYCAFAVANGATAKGDPLQWNVHEGKLYLNYNADISSQWRANKAAFILDANKNWPAVLK